jgi:hypothetical protein
MVAKEERQRYDAMAIMDGCVGCLPLNYTYSKTGAPALFWCESHGTQRMNIFVLYSQMKFFLLGTKEFHRDCQQVPRQQDEDEDESLGTNLMASL